MRIVKQKTINGREITLHELTVEEVINLLDGIDTGLIDIMFDGRLPLTVVSAASGISKDELIKWFPAEVDELITEVEAVNPHSARLCQKLIEIAGTVRAQPEHKASAKPVRK